MYDIHITLICLFVYLFVCVSRQSFSVALEPVLELALVDQAGLELTEIYLSLPPKCWDQRRVPLVPGIGNV